MDETSRRARIIGIEPAGGIIGERRSGPAAARGQLVLGVIGIGLARLRLGREIAVAVMAGRGPADRDLLVEAVLGESGRAVADCSVSVSVTSAHGLRDLARRVVGESHREVVGRAAEILANARETRHGVVAPGVGCSVGE